VQLSSRRSQFWAPQQNPFTLFPGIARRGQLMQAKEYKFSADLLSPNWDIAWHRPCGHRNSWFVAEPKSVDDIQVINDGKSRVYLKLLQFLFLSQATYIHQLWQPIMFVSLFFPAPNSRSSARLTLIWFTSRDCISTFFLQLPSHNFARQFFSPLLLHVWIITALLLCGGEAKCSRPSSRRFAIKQQNISQCLRFQV
jgi:hypothetical protein